MLIQAEVISKQQPVIIGSIHHLIYITVLYFASIPEYSPLINKSSLYQASGVKVDLYEALFTAKYIHTAHNSRCIHSYTKHISCKIEFRIKIRQTESRWGDTWYNTEVSLGLGTKESKFVKVRSVNVRIS